MEEDQTADNEKRDSAPEAVDANKMPAVPNFEGPKDGGNQPKQEGGPTAMPAYQKWNLGITIAGSMLALMGLFALIKQTYVMVDQNKLMIEQLKQTDRNLRLDQRAWLTSSRFRLIAEPEAGKPIHVDYFIQNSGKTPALDYYSQPVLFLASGMPGMQKFEEPKTFVSRSIVPPGSAGTASATLPIMLAELELSHYRSRADHLFIHAILRYRDIFGRVHWTTVCAYHTWGNPLDMFQYCASGNEMDQGQDQK